MSVAPLPQVATLATQTGLPADKLKLIYNGGVMKNYNLPVAGYGLKNGSQIVLVGSNESNINDIIKAQQQGGHKEPQQIKKKKEEIPTTDQGLAEYLNKKKQFVDEMQPEIDLFESRSQEFLARSKQKPPPPSGDRPELTWTKLQMEHARLTEILLQHLLKLDGIDIDSSMTQARASRKDAVKTVQRAMDHVDTIWGPIKYLRGPED